MLRDYHEDQEAPVAADATAEATYPFDGTARNAGSEGRRSRPRGQEAWLHTALETLPRAICLLSNPEQRLVIGCFFEHRPVGEVARELRLTPTRATVLLGEALRTLRVRIGG